MQASQAMVELAKQMLIDKAASGERTVWIRTSDKGESIIVLGSDTRSVQILTDTISLTDELESVELQFNVRARASTKPGRPAKNKRRES